MSLCPREPLLRWYDRVVDDDELAPARHSSSGCVASDVESDNCCFCHFEPTGLLMLLLLLGRMTLLRPALLLCWKEAAGILAATAAAHHQDFSDSLHKSWS